ncbi:hypothetical protein E2986_12959, partial [Frieseomelitta varia]
FSKNCSFDCDNQPLSLLCSRTSSNGTKRLCGPRMQCPRANGTDTAEYYERNACIRRVLSSPLQPRCVSGDVSVQGRLTS